MENIITLYNLGNSAQEIKEQLNLEITPRTIQRKLAKLGLTRSVKESYHLAMNKGRIKWAKKDSKIKRLKINPKLRYKILNRDNFKCVLCGNSAINHLLEVDHIDNNKNNSIESNLRVLCEPCNLGKELYRRIH